MQFTGRRAHTEQRPLCSPGRVQGRPIAERDLVRQRSALAGYEPAKGARNADTLLLLYHSCEDSLPQPITVSPQASSNRDRLQLEGVGDGRPGHEDSAAPPPVARARRSRPETTGRSPMGVIKTTHDGPGCRQGTMATTASPQAPFPKTGRPRRTVSNSTWRRSQRM